MEDMLRTTRDAGYRFIEVSRKHTDVTDLSSLLDSVGLTVWSFHGSLGNDAVSASDMLRRKAIEKEFTTMAEAAAFAPCPYVIHYLNRFNDPAVMVYWRKSVDELCSRAESLGLNLAIETAPYKPQVNERYPGSEEIAGFVRSYASPHLSVCVDINHSNIHESLPDVCRNCSGLISNIHVSDNNGEWEDHLRPGEGIIDLPGTLCALTAAGYRGPCNLECHFPDLPTVEMLRNLREYVEKCILSAGLELGK